MVSPALVSADGLGHPGVEPLFGVSRLHFRVLPKDLNTSAYLNNGRSLTLMDRGRIDVMLASGLRRSVLRHKWTPVASAIKIRFRREVRLFHRFEFAARIVAWGDPSVVMDQLFIFTRGPEAGHIAAQVLFKGRLYDRAKRQFVPIAHLMHEVGGEAARPRPSPEIAEFLQADDGLKRAARSSK